MSAVVRGGLRLAEPGMQTDAVADVVARIAFEVELDVWLETLALPGAPVCWRPRGHDGRPVESAQRLAELVEGLAAVGAWGIAERSAGATWAQCMRVREGWIVEVNGEPGPDCFVRRVRRAHVTTADRLRPRATVRDRGRLMATYRAQDVVATAAEAASIMWSWLRRAHLEGYELAEV